MMNTPGDQKGFALLTLIVSVTVLGLLYLVIAKLYFMPPTAKLDQATKKMLAGQGMDAQNMPDAVQKAKTALDNANDVLQQKDRDAQTLFNDGEYDAGTKP